MSNDTKAVYQDHITSLQRQVDAADAARKAKAQARPAPDFSDPAWAQADLNIHRMKSSGALQRAEIDRAHLKELNWSTNP